MKLVITGYPLGHTRSPALHRGFLKQAGLAGTYEVLPFDPARGRRAFFDFLDGLHAGGTRGVNVTIPHKEWAFEYCERRGAGPAAGFAGRCAKLVRAANTIVFAKGGARSANTDAAGLWDDLAVWLGPKVLHDAELLVVGTGGAARGVLAGVLARHPATRAIRVTSVWGRAAGKTRALRRLAPAARGKTPGEVLVIWCLPPLSRRETRKVWGALAPLIGMRKSWLYDLNYGARASATEGLVPKARRRSGLGMLKGQARASFELWRAVVSLSA